MADGYAHAEDGTRLACQRRGSGAPLVLLSGQANDHTWWDGDQNGEPNVALDAE